MQLKIDRSLSLLLIDVSITTDMTDNFTQNFKNKIFEKSIFHILIILLCTLQKGRDLTKDHINAILKPK